ncbi:MAG TPA: VPLPA-CTERM sorting domain-containing protein [Steroidobacteraceae bacterium]|nr:VPLPA-CTERM sorting domain-containing protein [Steroidobacteraceae bacterium]
MNTTTTMRTSLKLGLIAPLALTCLSVSPHAKADSLLLAQTTLVTGSASTVDSFTAPGAGTVTISLTSLDWPAALSALSFSATSATQVLSSWNGTSITSNIASFEVDAGTYFAHIMATASGALNVGLYSVVMTFSPGSGGAPSVPLPASGWMLLTGMFVLAGLARVVRPFELMGTAGA